jgi:hypothetical protein
MDQMDRMEMFTSLGRVEVAINLDYELFIDARYPGTIKLGL